MNTNNQLQKQPVVKNNFFVIDSFNLNNTTTKLYGYCVANDASYLLDENEETEELAEKIDPDKYSDGAYILVQNFSTEIQISQDFVGCFGLYLYEKEGYFALSNSFTFLVDYLKSKETLTLDYDYINTYFLSGLTSLAYSETMIKEIKCLPKNIRIIINKNTRNITLRQIDYKENTTPIDSQQAVDILDRWYFKWISIIRYLKSKTNKVSVDLSGGIDSRLTFLLFLKSGIDLNTILVHSITDSLHTHSEDYEIATMIAKKFDFKLNNSYEGDKTLIPFSLDDSIDLMAYIRLCFCTEIYNNLSCQKVPLYSFTGGGGEALRKHWDVSPEKFIAHIISRCQRYSHVDFSKSVYRILWHAFNVAREKYHIVNEESSAIVDGFYRETRCRNHFGKSMAINSLCNVFTLSPLLDSGLSKLYLNGNETTNRNIIIAIIFDRYCPELLDYKFDNNRSIEKHVLDYAHQINNKYPFRPGDNQYLKGKWVIHSDLEYKDSDSIPTTTERFCALLYRSFLSQRTVTVFEKHFDKELYFEARRYSETKLFHPEARYIPILGVVKIINDISGKSYDYTPHEFFYRLTKEPRINSLNLIEEIFATARIDIKNFSEINNDNDIHIRVENKSDYILAKPSWFHKNGIGYTLTSSNHEMDMEIKCLDNGFLTLYLRSMDIRDKNRQRIDYKIDYKKLIVNDYTIIDNFIPCSHDKPFCYKLFVEKGKIVKIHLEWEKHNYKPSEYFRIIMSIVESFSGSNNIVSAVNEEKIMKTEKEVRKLKSELMKTEKEMLKLKWDLINIKNGWSFKIGRIITFLPRRINKWIKN